MIDKLKNNLIILSLALFLIASFFFLAFIEQRQQNPDYQKNWWVLYFTDAKNSSLNFAIENHGAASNFHWEVFQDKDKVREGDIKIKPGETWTPDIQIDDLTGTIITKVSVGKDKKEIYKIISR